MAHTSTQDVEEGVQGQSQHVCNRDSVFKIHISMFRVLLSAQVLCERWERLCGFALQALQAESQTF